MSGQTGIGYETWQAYQLLDYDESIIGMFSIGLARLCVISTGAGLI